MKKLLTRRKKDCTGLRAKGRIRQPIIKKIGARCKILLVVNMLFCLSCQLNLNNSNKCEKFHQGKYIYKGKIYRGVQVKRDSYNQLEIVGDTLQLFYKIDWKDNCEYDLIFQI